METYYDVGKWIEIARISRGLTQQDLADNVVNLKQSNLSKMEKGLLKTPTKTLERIAEALHYPVSFFNDRTVRTPISTCYFRKRVSIPKKEKDLLFAKFDIIRRSIDCLLSNVELPDLKIQALGEEDSISPVGAADYTRRVLGVGNGPIKDIINILERNGIVIYEIDNISGKFDGITLMTDTGNIVIIINKSLSNDRKRFTIAHELGHYVLHFKSHFIDDARDTEREANIFASEFLFPNHEATRVLSNLKLGDLGLIKSQWLISKAAIIYRAKELGLITDQKKKYFMIELSRNGERRVENGTVYIDSPRIIKQAIEVYKELNYNEKDLSTISKLDISDFRDYFLDDNNTKLKVHWKKAI